MKKTIKSIFLISLSCFYIWILLISFCFTLTAFWLLAGSLILLLTFKQTATKSILLCLLLFFMLTPLNVKEYHKTSFKMQEEILTGNHLSFIEKLGIYNLNILLGVGAYPFYPEVAKEVWLLHLPVEGNIRTSRDTFFMQSTVIQKHIEQGKMGRVSWGNAKEYKGHEELRFGTALNPCKLSKTNTGYAIEVVVSYPEKCRTHLNLFGPYLPLYVEEGLFNYLQKEGWLFPYTQIYKL